MIYTYVIECSDTTFRKIVDSHRVKVMRCRDIAFQEGDFQCNVCGCYLKNPYDVPALWLGEKATIPNYCPNCGRKVNL